MLRKIILSLALLVLSALPGMAAGTVWVAECNSLGATDSGGSAAQVCKIPFLADTKKDISGGTQSVTVTDRTKLIRVCVDSQTAIKGATGVTTSNSVLFASTCEYFGVDPSSVVSFILEP